MTSSNGPAEGGRLPTNGATNGRPEAEKTAVLSRDLRMGFPRIVSGKGSYLTLDDGRRILDASGGAAVACIGHGDTRVHEAILAQLSQVSYCATTFYSTEVYEQLCRELVQTTKGHMSRAYIVNSGKFGLSSASQVQRRIWLTRDRLGGNGGGNEARPTVLPGKEFC